MLIALPRYPLLQRDHHAAQGVLSCAVSRGLSASARSISFFVVLPAPRLRQLDEDAPPEEPRFVERVEAA